MGRSLSIIAVMGVITMILLSMLGSSYLSRIGGAEEIPKLRDELLARHRLVVEDEDEFRVHAKRSSEGEEKKRWLLIRFRPTEDLAVSRELLLTRMRIMARQVYAQPRWQKRLDHVDVLAETPAEVVEVRVTREEALTRIGRPVPGPR